MAHLNIVKLEPDGFTCRVMIKKKLEALAVRLKNKRFVVRRRKNRLRAKKNGLRAGYQNLLVRKSLAIGLVAIFV